MFSVFSTVTYENKIESIFLKYFVEAYKEGELKKVKPDETCYWKFIASPKSDNKF